jgi:hypothetical protein
MTNSCCRAAVFIAGIYLFLGFGSLGNAETKPPIPSPSQKEAVMTHASGTFEVKLSPQAMDDKTDASLGRMSLDKQFHGDLDATSKGEMLSAGPNVKGSGGYVAIERVGGMLHGRKGSFVLQHSGTMTRGAQRLSISVVPDSGTGQLTGLTGEMNINIVDGKHFYDFEYALAET